MLPQRAYPHRLSRTLSVVDFIVNKLRQPVCHKEPSIPVTGHVSLHNKRRVWHSVRQYSTVSVKYTVQSELIEHQEHEESKSQSWLNRAGVLLSTALLLCGSNQSRSMLNKAIK